MKKLAALILLSVMSIAAYAQTDNDNADIMRSNGKIYVVVAVVLVILAGLLLYVVSLDRKISRLEKNK
ncbi:CcmD family protein [Sediminibacterium sp. WSJ-3]|nr:CcmD family protein [Sediminibacterium soli]